MAMKASEHIKTYKNENGPLISTVQRTVFEENGAFYKDIDGTGSVSAVNDWHKSPAERAQAYTGQLSLDEKLSLLFISDWRMGKYPVRNRMDGSTNADSIVLDESGVLDEAELNGKTIFGEQHLPGTSTLIKEWKNRHTILRENATTEDITDYLNQLQTVAEECEHFIPVEAASNSRNEHGEAVFGMNDASGVFAAWPGTLGIAAAVLGSGFEVCDQFAEAVRRSWNAVGLRKGYMYMADVVSDPRWQRTNGTFGENPELISDIFEHIVPRIQGGPDGVTADGVAMTVKHFPGGGARENGFDPHYKEGQWNVYQTPGSLEKYHLPAFKRAIKYHPASIMPYYAKPSKEKSAEQNVPMDPKGFAYNKFFIQELLRGQLGFDGYINSDTGIIHNMSWGVEDLDYPERIAYAVNEGSVDLISGLFDQKDAKEALDRAANDYYETHPLPEGYTKEQLTLSEEGIDRAVTATLTEMFALGMFENSFRCVQTAKEEVGNKEDWANAFAAHQQSVTLLKNSDSVLPLTAEKLEGKLVYAECFHKNPEMAKKSTEKIRELLAKECTLTENPAEADVGLFMLSPSSGAYFNATPGYLELDLCEGKEVCNTDEEGRPSKETHLETTLSGAGRLKELQAQIHANGGKVIECINFTMAWQLGNVEPGADVVLAGYDTYPTAVLDVVFGRFAPVGKLPLTLPRGDEVLKVNEEGVCISPNDVPGFDKDQYMPETLKDENGKAYAYRDADGNYYEYGFGLTY